MKLKIAFTGLFLSLIYSCKENDPTINFTFPCEVLAGQTFQISNSTLGADNYEWDFGNSQTSTVASPTISYSSPGNYTIKLTASDKDGDVSSTGSKSILVRPSPPLNKLLPVQYELQQTDNWCWAASTEMVLSNFNVYVNQCTMLNYYIFGNINGGFCTYCSCCSDPYGYYSGYSCIIGGYTFQIASDLSRYGNLYSETIQRALTLTEIKQEISQNRPIIIFYEPTTTFSGHYVVLLGYDAYNNVYINDPYYPSNPSNTSLPQYWIVPYSTSLSYQGGGNYLYWGASIYKIGGSPCQ